MGAMAAGRRRGPGHPGLATPGEAPLARAWNHHPFGIMPSILRRDRDSTSAAPSSPSTPRGLVVQAGSAPAVSCRLARRGPQQLVPRAPSGPSPSSSMSSTWLYRMERAGRRPTRRELADHARPEALSSLPELVSRPGWSTAIPARSRASRAANTPGRCFVRSPKFTILVFEYTGKEMSCVRQASPKT